MTSLLDIFRAHEAPPDRLLAGLPGSRIWYVDDTGGHDTARASWAPELDPAAAWRRQAEGCGVFCTLQAFAPPPAVGEIGPLRALSVDVTLLRPHERAPVARVEMDLRKDLYITRCLLRFPLRAHWVIETRSGLQVVFRIEPVYGAAATDEALRLHRELTDALLGDEDACGVIQHVRVPGWAQLDVPGSPFLCRLLLDRAAAIPPHSLDRVRRAVGSLPGPRPLPPGRA